MKSWTQPQCHKFHQESLKWTCYSPKTVLITAIQQFSSCCTVAFCLLCKQRPGIRVILADTKLLTTIFQQKLAHTIRVSHYIPPKKKLLCTKMSCSRSPTLKQLISFGDFWRWSFGTRQPMKATLLVLLSKRVGSGQKMELKYSKRHLKQCELLNLYSRMVVGVF